jgi:SAM-dependent methyltransferase
MHLHLSAAAVRDCALLIYRSFFSLPHAKSLEDFCGPFRSTGSSRTLDLGCGKTPKNPFHATEMYGTDIDFGIDEGNRILRCDLGVERLPFPDDHFDFVTAFDLIEHIPRLVYIDGKRNYSFIQLVNEIHRVLKPGGIFLSDTPAYPKLSALTDPTHVNLITIDTFDFYFCEPRVWAGRYGFLGKFTLIKQAWSADNLLTMMGKSA